MKASSGYWRALSARGAARGAFACRWWKGRAGAALLAALLALQVGARAYPDRAGAAPVRVTVAAVGDVLVHLPLLNSVFDRRTGYYNFSKIFAPMKTYLTAPDFTIANLETCMAGRARGYSGYPQFNSPADLAYHLRALGVDFLATANNHSMDMGWEGIAATLDVADRCGLAHAGTYRSAAEQATPFLADIQGIRIGILNYTYGTNGIPIPAGKDFAVNIISAPAIIAEAAAARQRGADVVICVLHFGSEYRRQPGEEQRRLALQLLEGGVDVIIGAHPHVAQPIEKVSVQRGGERRECVVAYSLGNFVSNQRDRYRDSGIALYVDIEKTPLGARVLGSRYLPVWVQKRRDGGRWQFRVLPAHPGIIPETDIEPDAADRARMGQVWEELTAHLSNRAQGILPVEPGDFRVGLTAQARRE